MSYIGVHLEVCGVIPFNWDHTSLVVVSGDGPNVCGHALIKVGFYYFHIAGLASRPYFMPEQVIGATWMNRGKPNYSGDLSTYPTQREHSAS
jgi:hypothetical protein